ncbi:MAG: hypothetical protein H6Q61_531 [Firmicutes bacterium]|nr:hypothetical protein [Bacillota bacterium]
MTINEKVAYLKGLADGLELDKEPTKEGKLLKVIIEVLEEIGFALEELEETDQLLSEGLDAVSEDLEDVEATAPPVMRHIPWTWSMTMRTTKTRIRKTDVLPVWPHCMQLSQTMCCSADAL